MKSLFIIFSCALFLTACNNGGESGVVNDGDSAGRVKNNEVFPPANPATDTAAGEHRVDIQKRDRDSF